MPMPNDLSSYLDQAFDSLSTERIDRTLGNRNKTKQIRERTVVEEINKDSVQYKCVTTDKVIYKTSTSVFDDTQKRTTSTTTKTSSMKHAPPAIPPPPIMPPLVVPEPATESRPAPAPPVLIRRGSYDEVFKRNGRLYMTHHKAKSSHGKR